MRAIWIKENVPRSAKGDFTNNNPASAREKRMVGKEGLRGREREAAGCEFAAVWKAFPKLTCMPHTHIYTHTPTNWWRRGNFERARGRGGRRRNRNKRPESPPLTCREVIFTWSLRGSSRYSRYHHIVSRGCLVHALEMISLNSLFWWCEQSVRLGYLALVSVKRKHSEHLEVTKFHCLLLVFPTE